MYVRLESESPRLFMSAVKGMWTDWVISKVSIDGSKIQFDVNLGDPDLEFDGMQSLIQHST